MIEMGNLTSDRQDCPAKSNERLLSLRFLLSYNIYIFWVSLRKMNWKASIFLPAQTYKGSAKTDWPLFICTLRTQLYLASCHLGLIFFFHLTSASFIMQSKFLLMLRLHKEEWAGQHVSPHLDSQMNSYSSSPHATEVSRFSNRGSMSCKKERMQYLGIVVLLTGGNVQIQQMSASALSQLLGYS